MKNKFIKVLSAAILILAVLVNCTKNHSIDNLNSDKDQIQNDNELILKIHKFQELAKQQRNGIILKSVKKTSIDSALFYINATFNYTYCFSTSVYNKMHWDTTYICFPNNQNEEVLFDDVVTAYNKSVDSVRLKYRLVSDTSKKLVAVVFEDLGTDANNYRQVVVISQIGTGSNLSSKLGINGKFSEDDEYWYLRDTYKCDLTGTEGAPNIIDNELLFKYKPASPPGQHVSFIPQDVIKFVYNDYENPNGTTDNYCDYYIFYATNAVIPSITNATRCLDYDQYGNGIHEMDFYLDGSDMIIADWLENNNPDDLSFIDCLTVSRNIYGPPEVIKHELNITVGDRIVTYIEERFPIYID